MIKCQKVITLVDLLCRERVEGARDDQKNRQKYLI